MFFVKTFYKDLGILISKKCKDNILYSLVLGYFEDFRYEFAK